MRAMTTTGTHRCRGRTGRSALLGTVFCLLLAGCGLGPSATFEEVLEPSVLPHQVWGRPDLRYSGRGPRVAILSDDTLRVAEADVRRALAGYSLKVAAISGEGFTGGERSSVDPSVGMERIARMYGEDAPRRVVVALGFHDLRRPGPDHMTLMGSANAVFDEFGEACVVGVTNITSPPLPDHRTVRARALNDLVEERSDRVVDWNTMVRQNPEFLSDDGFTPSPEGAEVLVHAVRLNVEACV